MPGTFETVYFVAFDLDDHKHPVRAFSPQIAPDKASGIEKARVLASEHAGAVVWRRQGRPAIGEEGEPEVLFSLGAVGDFS
jgi:hypothetical protein